MSNNSLIISSNPISQDADNRYCLNDLHKAAGDELKHKPANWLRLDQTKALIDEIDHCSEMRTAVEVINGGNNRGTFVVKELVYAYAMWISPAFMLKVIRAYDALTAPTLPDYTHPITVQEFETRHAFHTQALAQLNAATITLTVSGADCLRFTKNLNDALSNNVNWDLVGQIASDKPLRNMYRNTEWRQDDIATLQAMLAKGFRCADIAEELGRTVDGVRNAVKRYAKVGAA